VRGGGYKERMKEGEYSENNHVLVYENETMKPVETILRMVRG
jgi:hypothetical protein